jgi:hypothetical protein
MRLYEHAWPSKYEEIKTWYPVWYREFLEMDALWRAFGGQLDEAQAGIVQAVDNNFIDFADAQALTRLESFLGIEYDGPRTPVERRNVLKAFVVGNGHIGQKQIKELVSAFTDGEIEIALAGGMVRVAVTRDFGDRFSLYDCHLVLDRRIPAHLALELVDRLVPVRAANRGLFAFEVFEAGFSAREGSALASGPALGLAGFGAGLRAAHAYGFAGRIVIDSRWALDGKYALDGSRSLTSALTEEEI